MSALHSALKGCVALVGLCAVLLGAFEHEDLIFQDRVAGVVVAEAGAGPEAGLDAGMRSEVAGDSGTEGTFRSEHYRFWLSPRPDTPFARWPEVLGKGAGSAFSPGGGRAGGWPRRVGIMALRL